MFPVMVFESSLAPKTPIVFQGTLYNVHKGGSAEWIPELTYLFLRLPVNHFF